MAGGLLSAFQTLRSNRRENEETRRVREKEDEQLEESRFPRAIKQLKYGNTDGFLDIMNQGKTKNKWVTVKPAQDDAGQPTGGFVAIDDAGHVSLMEPENIAYALSEKVDDPLEEGKKQWDMMRAEYQARGAGADANVAMGTEQSRIAKSKADAGKSEIDANQALWKAEEDLVTSPDRIAKSRAEARGEQAKTTGLNAANEQAERMNPVELETAKTKNWADKVKAGIDARASSGGGMKPGEKARLSLAERKDVSAVLDKVNEALYAYGDKPQYQAALNSMSLLPFDVAQRVVAQAAADLANTPATKDEKAVARRQSLETFLKIAQTQMKARQATEQEEGGLTTGMPAQPPAQATPAQPAQPPASPLSEAQIQDQVRNGPPPVSPVRPGQAPTPGPMMAPQTKATPPTLRPPGPQAPSPQAGPKVSAMASGGDTNELTQAIMTMLRNNLITREQAKQLAGQSGL